MQKVHMSLAVADLSATSEFYETLFRSRPVKTKGDYVKFLPEDLALNISFSAAKSTRSVDTGAYHLGIEFPSQAALDREYDRLRGAGLISGKRESSICCYADQDKFKVRDPDGYEWELYYLLSDSEIKMQPNTNCCEVDAGRVACCP